MFANILLKNMKIIKINHFFFLFLSLVIISCNSDDDITNPINETKAENLKPLGTSASDLLSQNTYASLTVELAYNSGYRPTQETIDDFKIFLENRVYKPDGITFVETEVSSPFVDSQTLDDIKEIENEQRNYYTLEDDITVFIYFTQAKASTDTNTAVTLGTAYLNTSIVVYEKTIRDVSISQNTSLYLLEETTLQHEFGHLFGLVNIQDDDIHSEHEDLAHKKHCIIENCVMYYESNLSSSLRNKVSVPVLDQLCIEDLQAKGGK
jgi:predicted Zn-dependent protease